MAITKRVTIEEKDDQGGMPPPNTPPMDSRQDDNDFNPQDHPWDYNDQARMLISDRILTPTEDQLKEFTFMPQGIINEMVLGDTMVAMMKNYADKKFNAAEFLLKTVDKRLRGLDGKMVKYAVLLAGDENKNEEINPMNGPTL
jgi:hypothetical protein